MTHGDTTKISLSEEGGKKLVFLNVEYRDEPYRLTILADDKTSPADVVKKVTPILKKYQIHNWWDTVKDNRIKLIEMISTK